MSQQIHVMRKVIRSLTNQGCIVTNAKKGWRVKCPNGSVFTIHYTPKSNGDHMNILRQETRRHGLEWQL